MESDGSLDFQIILAGLSLHSVLTSVYYRPRGHIAASSHRPLCPARQTNMTLGVIHQLFVRLHHALVISAPSLVMMVRSQLTRQRLSWVNHSDYPPIAKLYHFIELHEVSIHSSRAVCLPMGAIECRNHSGSYIGSCPHSGELPIRQKS
jgi:hypothetical protein